MATDASGFVPSPSPNHMKRKKFLFEEEDIVIKPSTELIPDEYEHLGDDSVLFHIFRTPLEEDLAEDLVQCVQNINYKVNQENIHELNTVEEFKTDLETVKKSCANKDALLLIFIGYFGKEEDTGSLLLADEEEHPQCFALKKIWNMFSSNNCPELKNKPKIFIFCTSPKPEHKVQVDSKRHYTMDYDKVYDFPAESDMLIVYKKVDDEYSRNKEIFLQKFGENIQNFSKKFDIIDLVSYININNKTVPLIISTLTRKFYLTPSNEREHYLSVMENRDHLEEILQKIQEDLRKLQEVPKRKLKFSFSFRKKSEEKPVVKKETSKTEQPKSPKKVENKPASRKTSTTRLSSSAQPSGRRSRPVSESDGASVNKKNEKKPIWKL